MGNWNGTSMLPSEMCPMWDTLPREHVVHKLASAEAPSAVYKPPVHTPEVYKNPLFINDEVGPAPTPAPHAQSAPGFPPEFRSAEAAAPDERDWSVLTETISYASPPLAPIHIHHQEPMHIYPQEQINDFSETRDPFFTPYKGVRSVINESRTYDNRTDISTTFIGPKESPCSKKYVQELSIPFDTCCTIEGSLTNGDKLQILFDTGATRSYLSQDYYNRSSFLKRLPKFDPRGERVYMGSGDWVPALFIIPVIISIGDCCFEVYTLVCRLTTTDFMWGMKNMIETEGTICTRTMKYNFLNRSPRILAVKNFSLPPWTKVKHPVPVEMKVEFPQELSGHAVAKLLLIPKSGLVTVKVPVCRNIIKISLSNDSNYHLSFSAGNVIGILDVRSLGYFHIGMDQLKKACLQDYNFQSFENLTYHQMNRMIDYVNIQNKPQEQTLQE